MLNVLTRCDTNDVHLSIPYIDNDNYSHTQVRRIMNVPRRSLPYIPMFGYCALDLRAARVCVCVRPVVAMLHLLSKYERPTDISPQLFHTLLLCLAHFAGCECVCISCFKFNSVFSCWPTNFRGNCKYLNDR